MAKHAGGGAGRPVLLAAGGTAGHLFPAEALAAALARRAVAVELATDARAARFAQQFPANHVHVVASATLYFDTPSSGPACGAVLTVPAGRNASVMVPSGEVRINQEFDVLSSKATAILLDFDGGRSLNLTGNGTYMLSPVISVVNVR